MSLVLIFPLCCDLDMKTVPTVMIDVFGLSSVEQTNGSMTRRNTYVCERSSTDRYSAIPNGKDSRWVVRRSPHGAECCSAAAGLMKLVCPQFDGGFREHPVDCNELHTTTSHQVHVLVGASFKEHTAPYWGQHGAESQVSSSSCLLFNFMKVCVFVYRVSAGPLKSHKRS